jgi:uncharacterized membrane protein
MNTLSFVLIMLAMWPVATFANWVARPSDPFDETVAMGLLGSSFAGFGAIITYVVITPIALKERRRRKERKIIPHPEDDFLLD